MDSKFAKTRLQLNSSPDPTRRAHKVTLMPYLVKKGQERRDTVKWYPEGNGADGKGRRRWKRRGRRRGWKEEGRKGERGKRKSRREVFPHFLLFNLNVTDFDIAHR